MKLAHAQCQFRSVMLAWSQLENAIWLTLTCLLGVGYVTAFLLAIRRGPLDQARWSKHWRRVFRR